MEGGLEWLELDLLEPAALRMIRDVGIPVASLEVLFGRKQYMPSVPSLLCLWLWSGVCTSDAVAARYFEAAAVDVAIVDVLYNGFWESLKIASLADAYEVNVATHNYMGHLGLAISAHFSAAIPNFRTCEVEVDDVPWKDELFLSPPRVVDGFVQLPSGPGWGVEPDERALARHPPVRSRAGVRPAPAAASSTPRAAL